MQVVETASFSSRMPSPFASRSWRNMSVTPFVSPGTRSVESLQNAT